ncbi:hypothetical protein TNIN_429841 [Trichonephila inaurata madagascariensis]|uniref:Uncharacterized protein n=1 Tax=Trichonephila inaurata madagascariensis TaxID=2747483 RepID=A0A8X6WMH3_9ARAC|nr:hypothetical protein TNIN_429841 [Trichonephila inaurata madagascariensis]
MNAVETAFEQLRKKAKNLKRSRRCSFRINDRVKLYAKAYNIEFEAIEGYAEKMIARQVRVKKYHEEDALGQDNHSLVTSSLHLCVFPRSSSSSFLES